MKVAFVHFGRENLGIESLSSVLKINGHKVFLAYDPGLFSREDNVFNVPFLERVFSKKDIIIKSIEREQPDLVAFSAFTSTYQWLLSQAKEIKSKLNLPVLFGGIHPTLVPEEVISRDFIDFVIAGEGEFPLLELVESLGNRQSLRKIKNLWYKEGNSIIKNDLRAPISDLDCLPFPDKELFKNDIRYRDCYMLLVGRGCPYSCSFCCESFLNNLYEGGYFRRRSVNSVMDELIQAKKRYKFRQVYFFDPIFFADRKWTINLLSRYSKEIAVPFKSQGHVNFLNDEMAGSLKAAGCYCVSFGVQTFNQNIREKILNRHESNEQIIKALEICDKHKLRYDIDLILGLPGCTEKDYTLPLEFMHSRKYLNRIKTYYLSFSPKLSIIQAAEKAGMIDEEHINMIRQGFIGDWFHVPSENKLGNQRLNDSFSRLYKIYSIIPKRIVKIIVRRNLHRYFYLIPGFLIVLLRLVVASKNKDYRVMVFIKNYLFHASKLLKERLRI